MIEEKYSYSKLACFEQCPYRYKLTYIDDHYIDCPRIATDFGTLIHHIEEEIGKSLQEKLKPNYQELLKEFDSEILNIKEKYPKDFINVDKSGRTYGDKAEYYRQSGIYRLEKRLQINPNLEIVGLEKEFYLTFNQYLFHGFIDRIFYDKSQDVYIIEDIKTYAQKMGSRDLKTPLQHVIYSLALKSSGIDKIRCTYDLPLCDLTQNVAEGYLDRGIEKLNELFNDIKYSDFAPRPTPLCHWCIFSGTYPDQPDEAKGLCPYYCEWTRENKTMRSNYRWLGTKKHEQILENFKKSLEHKH